MAKTSLKVKAARKPKFGVRAYTRCNRCGRPHSVYRKFGLCRVCLREARPPWRTPRCHQEQLVKRTSQVPGNRRNRDEEGE